MGEAKSISDLTMFVGVVPEADITNYLLIYFESVLPKLVGPGEIKNSLSFIRNMKRKYRESIQDIRLRDRVATRLKIEKNDLQTCAQRMPQEIIEASEMLSEYFSKSIIEELIAMFWMSTLSSYGSVHSAIEVDKPSLESHESIVMRDNHELIYSIRNDKLIISVAGHVFYSEVPFIGASPMLETLRRGDTVKVKTLVNMGTKKLSGGGLKL